MTDPRVSNAAIMVRLDAIDARLSRIDANIGTLDERLRGMETSSDQQHPLIDERISKLSKAMAEHEERLRRLEEAMVKMEQTNRLLTWVIGLVAAGTVGWIVTNLLEGIK